MKVESTYWAKVYKIAIEDESDKNYGINFCHTYWSPYGTTRGHGKLRFSQWNYDKIVENE